MTSHLSLEPTSQTAPVGLDVGQYVRTLHMKSCAVSRKLEAAQQLLLALQNDEVSQCQSTAECGSLSEHMLRTNVQAAFDIVIALLMKSGASEGTALPRLDPAWWLVLFNFLRLKSFHPPDDLPAGLSAAAAAAAKAGGGALGDAVGAALEVLATCSFWQPSLEHSCTLLLAALQAAAPKTGHCSWTTVSVHCVTTFRRAADKHPNPKKLFSLVTSQKTLLPLLEAAFGPSRVGIEVSPIRTELGCAVKELLAATLLTPVQSLGLGEACTAAFQRGRSQKLEPDINLPEDGNAANSRGQLDSYHLQLFHVLGRACKGGDWTDAATALASMPWFLAQLCASISKHRNNLASANHESHEQEVHAEQEKHTGRNSSTREAEGVTLEYAVFQRFCLLALEALEHSRAAISNGDARIAQKQPILKKRRTDHTATTWPALKTSESLSTLSALLIVAKDNGIYQSTQDHSGQQLDLLNQITSLVLKDIQNWRGLPCVSATCALFAGAMINLEHKAVLPHLKGIWDLLWDLGTIQESCFEGLLLSEFLPDGQLSSGQKLATSISTMICTAFAELRQIQQMLEIMIASMTTSSTSGALVVLSSSGFQQCFKECIQQLHAGLASPLLLWVSESYVSSRSLIGDNIQACGLVYSACLQSVKVDISTAPAVGAAVHKLLHGPFSIDLATELRAVVTGSSPSASLRTKLSIYGAILHLHASCSCLHPDVAPLPGQQLAFQVEQPLGYFSPLVGADSHSLPELHEFAKRCLARSGLADADAELVLVIVLAVMHRTQVLRESLQRSQFSCPTLLCSELSQEASLRHDELKRWSSRITVELEALSEFLGDVVVEIGHGDVVEGFLAGSPVGVEILRGSYVWLPWAQSPAKIAIIRLLVGYGAAGNQDLANSLLLNWLRNNLVDSSSVLIPTISSCIRRHLRAILSSLDGNLSTQATKRRRKAVQTSKGTPVDFVAAIGNISLDKAAPNMQKLCRRAITTLKQDRDEELDRTGSIASLTAGMDRNNQLLESSFRYINAALALGGVLLPNLLHVSASHGIWAVILQTEVALVHALVQAVEHKAVMDTISQLVLLLAQCRRLTVSTGVQGSIPGSKGPLPSACACEWMLHTGYYISSVAWRYQVWQSVNEASSFINSTGRAVTNALRSTSCKDSKDEDEEVQVLLQCLENYATVPTNEKNTTSTEMELLRAWIGAVACESVVLAARRQVDTGSLFSTATPGTISALPAVDRPQGAQIPSFLARILPSALKCIRTILSAKVDAQYGNSHTHIAIHMQTTSAALSAAGGLMRLLEDGIVPGMEQGGQPAINDSFRHLNSCHQLACNMHGHEDDIVVTRLTSFMQSISKTLFSRNTLSANRLDNFSCMHTRLVLLHVKLAGQLLCSSIDKGLPEVAQEALWMSFRSLILNVPDETCNAAYDTLGNLIIHESWTLACAALLLLEGCAQADRTVLHWSGNPSSKILDSLVSSLLSFCTRALCGDQDETRLGLILLPSAISCLEHIASKDKVFSMPPQQVACCLNLPSDVVWRIEMANSTPGIRHECSVVSRGGDIYSTCCGLLGAVLRHHPSESKRCMATVAASVRALLRLLVASSTSLARPAAASAPGHSAARSQEHMARGVGRSGLHRLRTWASCLSDVLSEISAHGKPVSKYCVYILADYIIATTNSSKRGKTHGAWDGVHPDLEAVLRLGVMSVYGICTPLEVQHLHTMLGQAAGGSRRHALENLRKDYEKTFKYSGKV